jgi:hypothetical protein
MQHAGPRAGRLNFTASEQPRIELPQRDRDHGQNVAADCTVVLRTNRRTTVLGWKAVKAAVLANQIDEAGVIYRVVAVLRRAGLRSRPCTRERLS